MKGGGKKAAATPAKAEPEPEPDVPPATSGLDLAVASLLCNLDPSSENIAAWPADGGPGALMGKASALLSAGDLAGALALYQNLLDGDLDLEGRLGIVHTLVGLGQEDKGLEQALDFTEHYPDCLYGWLLQARLMAAQGFTREAVASVDEALRVSPGWATLWNLRGVLQGALGQWKEAHQSFVQANQIQDAYTVAWNNQGTALMILGDVDGAIKALGKALTLAPKYPEALSNLGNALLLKGEPDKAARAFRGATVLSDGAGIQFNLAAALERLGQREEALGRYDAILARNPEYEPAQKAKGRIETG